MLKKFPSLDQKLKLDYYYYYFSTVISNNNLYLSYLQLILLFSSINAVSNDDYDEDSMLKA